MFTVKKHNIVKFINKKFIIFSDQAEIDVTRKKRLS